jgi:toxin ParE1/3/4
MIVRWVPRAEASLLQIIDYIAADNPAAAADLMREIIAKTSRLARFPYMGRPGFHPETRELLVRRNFLVVYQVWAESVDIVQVWHAAQSRGRG